MHESSMDRECLTLYTDRTRPIHALDNGCWTLECWWIGGLRLLRGMSSDRQQSFGDPLHTDKSRRIGLSFGINTNRSMLITTLHHDVFLRSWNMMARLDKI